MDRVLKILRRKSLANAGIDDPMSAKKALALLEKARNTLAMSSPHSPAVQEALLDLATLFEAIQSNHGAEDDGPI